MNKQWNILHFSDLHLHDPETDDGPEHLRKKHFDEYIRDLARAVHSEINAPIDCLVITGDFVNIGRFANYEHATEVIKFACKEFKINQKQVVVCPGNHDLIKDDELNGKSDSARAKYRSFESKWANKLADKKNCNKRAALCKIGKNLFALSIDSTLGAKSPFVPGPGAWDKGESKDAALEWVKRELESEDQLLVVLSHYPVEEFQGTLIADEEEHFIAKHIWINGKELAMRIGNWRAGMNAKTLWLSGDVHVEYRTCCYGIDFVTAGRLGVRAEKGGDIQTRQAKVIQVTAGDAATKVFTFNYKMPGSGMRNAGGRWSVESDFISTKVVSREKAFQDSESENTVPARALSTSKKRRKTSIGNQENVKSTSITTLTNPTVSKPISSNIETLDIELESQIIANIADKRLYSVGRFETNETDTSLSWVSIGPLLNTTGILPVTIKAMYQWIGVKLNQAKNPTVFEKTLFLGMDCWGAVLASQLSILSGAQNFCVASRGSGFHYTAQELISERVIKKVKECRFIVLVHDVVGTGQSLQIIHDQVTSKIDSKETSKISWYALSLICDNSRSRNDTSNFLSGHGTACGALRMPILAKSQLPDERVLPPQLSFNLHKKNNHQEPLISTKTSKTDKDR
jgi:hypothetical protein